MNRCITIRSNLITCQSHISPSHNSTQKKTI